MHKKSADTTHPSPSKPNGTTPTPAQDKTEEQTLEEEKERRTKDSKSDITKEVLRENSIAALRAKAQEHNAKMLSTAPDKTHKEETEEDQTMEEETTEAEKTNWNWSRDCCQILCGSLVELRVNLKMEEAYLTFRLRLNPDTCCSYVINV